MHTGSSGLGIRGRAANLVANDAPGQHTADIPV